jgi:competence protein ComEC
MFPLAFLCLFLPFLDIILSFFANTLEYISLFLSNIQIGDIVLAKPDFLILVIYYIFITLCIRGMRLKKYSSFLGLAMLIFIHHNINYFNSNPFVVFIDVGQGDCAFINLPHNQGNILIDTGGKLSFGASWEKKEREYKIGEDTIIPYLKSIGVAHLDYLMLSHGDDDHMGESINIVNHFKVKTVILNSGSLVTLEESLIRSMKKLNITYNFAKEGDILKIGDYTFNFLNPYIDTNENDNSLVVYTNLSGQRFLFVGDISTKIERRLTGVYSHLKVDILKVGHHGSITSTSEAFLDAIEPKYGVISVGLHNRFNHPSHIVVERLKSRHIKVLQTSINGSIKFIIRANDVTLISALT